MPEAAKPNVNTVKIVYPDSEGYDLSSVLNSPRQVTRNDLEAAVANLQIEYPADMASDFHWPMSLIGFVLKDYFVQCHQSGLYNRHKRPFESIPKVDHVMVRQIERGMMEKVLLPAWELTFLSARKEPYLSGLVFSGAFIKRRGYEEMLATVKEHFVQLQRTKAKFAGHPAIVNGAFIACGAPFPEQLTSYFYKLTDGEDALGRIETLHPEPLACHINLVEIFGDEDRDLDEELADDAKETIAANFSARLIYPALKPLKKQIDPHLKQGGIRLSMQ